MQCRKCSHQFCWICRGDWMTHKACAAIPTAQKAKALAAQSELEVYERYLHRWNSVSFLNAHDFKCIY